MTKPKKAKIPQNAVKVIKLLAFILVFAVIVLLAWHYNVFSVDTIVSHSPHNWFLAIIFIMVIYALCTLSFVFPIAVIYIAAGTIFPLWLALIVNFAGASLCIILPYIFGYYKGAESVNKTLKKYPKLQKIFELEKNNEWFLSYFLRVINLLPMDLASIYLGANKVKFIKYYTGSMAGNLPGLISITIVGSSITNPLSPTFIVSLIITILISAASLVVFYIYKKRKINDDKLKNT